MCTCVHAHTETPPAKKITKKIRKKQRWPSEKKKAMNIRTVPMHICVHVHMLKEITALQYDRSDGARQKTTPRVVFFAYYCT